tara:strand:- start:515 stop:820 length:306 start_codon:yes stop_codon:yes gene_type:complete
MTSRKTNNQLIKDIIISKDNLNRLMLVEWFDPCDHAEETTIDDLDIQRAVYESCGFLMGVSNDHLVIGYNKDMSETGKYKGYGSIPLPLIINVHIMDRNCD